MKPTGWLPRLVLVLHSLHVYGFAFPGCSRLCPRPSSPQPCLHLPSFPAGCPADHRRRLRNRWADGRDFWLRCHTSIRHATPEQLLIKGASFGRIYLLLPAASRRDSWWKTLGYFKGRSGELSQPHQRRTSPPSKFRC